MLSYATFGRQGLGNQLFQYAYLRTMARRLGTQFYCRPWIGDRVFTLDDAAERSPAPRGLRRSYIQPHSSCGFDELSLGVGDHTEICGFFQSARFWSDAAEVRRWFQFRPEAVAAVTARHRHIAFERSARLHVRFGDMDQNLLYYPPTLRYYRTALERIRHRPVLVFSDDIAKARRALRRLDAALVFVEGNAAHEDLYLMSRCAHHIGSVSTLSWWGAWLSPQPDAVVIVPREGATRPGNPATARDFWDPGWTQVRALRGIVDGYRMQSTLQRLKHRLRSTMPRPPA